jgi:UDP-glucose 4-epimerase
MKSRRILITGLSSHWGGRLAQALERDPEIEAVIGVDTADPKHELDRTEFVRVDTEHARIRRIVSAAAVDTVIDTRLIVDPLTSGAKQAHEVNVAGTINILEACGGADSPVRKFVFKSSAHWYGSEHDDPAFFTEEMERRRAPRTPIERDIVEAERAVSEFGARNRTTIVTVLRVAQGIGGDLRSSHLALLGLPVVPSIFGFDPRCQFIHEDDIVGVLEHAVRHQLPGTYNAAADGVLALSEVVSLLGKPMLPVLPPWGTTFAAGALQRLGLRMPVELLDQLRFGRGLDNRRLKAAGYAYRYTTREAVLKLRAHQRLRPLLRSGPESYTYEREVEEFLRWSPSVQSARSLRADGGNPDAEPPIHGQDDAEPPIHGYDELTVAEVVEIVASMEAPSLARLRSYEEANRGRSAVLEALDRTLARKGFGGPAS